MSSDQASKTIGGHVAINTQKVIVGGVAAGFAVGVVDYLVNGFLRVGLLLAVWA